MNEAIRRLLCSGVSQRRIARLLGLNRKTVVRKFLFLGQEADLRNQEFLQEKILSGAKTSHLQFDEMESSERSKCLPLSIPLVVEAESRKVLAFGVCSMPAKGPLARISYRKYGPRPDHRPREAARVLRRIAPLLGPNSQITSDENPKYPSWLRRHLPPVLHVPVKGQRGCVSGQGELKKIGFDPLFSLNHTAAMFRANINRLFRRTWCNSKRAERLRLHIALYVDYHNRELTS